MDRYRSPGMSPSRTIPKCLWSWSGYIHIYAGKSLDLCRPHPES